MTPLLLWIHRRVLAKLVRRLIGNAASADELAGDLQRLFPDGLEARTADAVALAEAALHGTEARRAVWEDADYLVAILATLTRDGDRARAAAVAAARSQTDPLRLAAENALQVLTLAARRDMTIRPVSASEIADAIRALEVAL